MSERLQFRGSFNHLVDEKGRVSIPSQFRQLLQDSGETSLVLTNFVTEGARCLEVYTLPQWRLFEERFQKKSRFDPKIRALEHFYFARAAVCSIDGNGRVNIPTHLRNYAGIGKEVQFTASFQCFRIWDKRVADHVFQQAEAELLENPTLFMDLDVE
jgi:MraZ protein